MCDGEVSKYWPGSKHAHRTGRPQNRSVVYQQDNGDLTALHCRCGTAAATPARPASQAGKTVHTRTQRETDRQVGSHGRVLCRGPIRSGRRYVRRRVAVSHDPFRCTTHHPNATQRERKRQRSDLTATPQIMAHPHPSTASR
jgi:hypothetical protein